MINLVMCLVAWAKPEDYYFNPTYVLGLLTEGFEYCMLFEVFALSSLLSRSAKRSAKKEVYFLI